MRPLHSWNAAVVFLALIGTPQLTPRAAEAAGINLSWDDCGAAGAEIKTFACDTNTSDPFLLVASFVPPPGIADYLGLSSGLRIAGPVLPDWWKHGNGSCRGSTGLSVSFEAPGGACMDFWQGRGVGGFVYEVGYSGPNTAQLRVQAAVPYENRGPLDPGGEYYAFTVRLQRGNATLPSACSGCDAPVGVALEHITLYQPPEANHDPILTAPIHRSVAFWQDPVALPTIAQVFPLAGAQGTPVRIEGTGLGNATSVRIGGLECSFQVESDQAINAVVPAAPRSGQIVVSTPAGTVTSSVSFTAPPLVSTFVPATGRVGTVVTINGFNLANVTGVAFNGAGVQATILSDTDIRATVPAGATTGPITVTNPAGSSSTSLSFIVGTTGAPPTLTSFEPQASPTGATVVILGSGFGTMRSVRFGGVEAMATVMSDTRIDAVVPPLARSGFIVVITASGSVASAISFTAQPVISSFAPSSVDTGSQVQIRGFNFTGTTAVRIGGVAANFGVISDILVLAQVPPTAVTGPIEVVNAVGTTVSSAVLVIGSVPTLVSFAPQLGATGTTVVLQGSGFTDIEEVRFGGVASTFTVVSVSRIDATVPALARSGTIRVRNPFGSANSSAAFTAPPVISEFNPPFASDGGEVSVSGINFDNATSVRIGGVAATFNVLYAQMLTLQVPVGAVTGAIEVENPAGVGISAFALQIGARPILTSFAPQAGAPGSTVALEGSGFTEVRSVRFGGASAAYTVVSPSRIDATVPPDAISGAITVTTLFGSATSVGPFMAQPVVTGFNPAYGPVGAEIGIRGYNLGGATEVRFNGVLAVFSVDSEVAIRATIPSGATSGPVSVTNAAGTGTSTQVFLVGEFSDGGINLAWDDCGSTGTSVKPFACDSNTGAPFSVVASFSPPPGIDLFLGLSSTLSITGDEMPNWWHHSAAACRGTTGIATNFDFTSGPFTCADFYAGRAAGGFAYDIGYGAPNRSRLRIQVAVPFENRGPVDGDREYYAFKVNLLRSKTTGTGACSGCGTPMQIALDEIQLFQPPEAGNDPVLTTPLHSAIAFWQSAPGPVPPIVTLLEPTRELPGGEVSIAGRYLAPTTSVRFGSLEAQFVIESDEHVRATVPVGAVDGPITVTTPGGTATSSEVFQVGERGEGPNLVVDPSFEGSVSAWRPVEGSIDRSGTARSGDYSMVARGTASVRRFDLDDRPNHVASTPRAGASYRFTAWIKSLSGDVRARVRVREQKDSTHVQTASAPEVTLNAGWQRVACEVTSVHEGSTLAFQFVFIPTVPEALVLVDDVSIREQGTSPRLAAPALVEAAVGSPVEIAVTATGTPTAPLVALGADVSGLPMLSNAAFAVEPDFSHGVLSWTPQPEDAGWEYHVTFRGRSQVDGVATTRIHVAESAPDPRTMRVDFDTPNFSRWRSHRGATLEHASPGRKNSPGALLARSPAPHTTFGINDYPNWVAYTGTAAGERFRFSCWMKGVSGAGNGMLRVNEYLLGVKVGSTTMSQEIPLTDQWQQVVVERVSEVAGSSLDIRIECDPTTAGTSFMIDDLSIRYPSSIPAAERFAAGGDYAPIRPTMFPNPVRDLATLSWTLAQAGLVKVGIYDVNGRRVRSLLHDPEAQPGTHHLMIERRDARGESIASGVYFYRIESVEGVKQGRFVVLE